MFAKADRNGGWREDWIFAEADRDDGYRDDIRKLDNHDGPESGSEPHTLLVPPFWLFLFDSALVFERRSCVIGLSGHAFS